MDSVKVNIAGHDYKLQSEESAEYVVAVSKNLDRQLSEKIENNMNLVDACIITALDLMDKNNKTQIEIEKLMLQLKEYMDDNAKLLTQVKKAEQSISKLENENENLWNEFHNPKNPAGKVSG